MYSIVYESLGGPGGVRYYDEDRDVNRIVARLLGKCGLSCTDLKDGVICKGNVASSYACVAKGRISLFHRIPASVLHRAVFMVWLFKLIP